MSASTSCSERAERALSAIRRGESVADKEARALGEECPAEFFRIVIESLADSFDPVEALAYERLMRSWIPEIPHVEPVIPHCVDVAYVLSRVTLGSDIKITSGILQALKYRFPRARIVLVGAHKTAELFAVDERIEHLEMDYPRSGTMSARLEFAHALRRTLDGENRIVVDPDSRMTQLGLIPPCEPQYYFHFPSRSAGSDTSGDLSLLARNWFHRHFGEPWTAGWGYIAPHPVSVTGERPWVTVSLGVGGNDTKRMGSDFESLLMRSLSERYGTLWVDRGAGGEEASRVTAAVETSGAASHVKFWEGSFAGFASVIAQSDLYVGYDSAGQHAAAAAGTSLVTIFAGAPSVRFRQRWAASGEGYSVLIDADGLTPETVLEELLSRLPDSPGHSIRLLPGV